MAATAIGAILVGNTVHQQQQQVKLQKRALREQTKAQEQAVADAARTARIGREQIARANRQQPDIAALLAGAQNPNPTPTMLSGLGGINPDRYKLGKGATLLGEVV